MPASAFTPRPTSDFSHLLLDSSLQGWFQITRSVGSQVEGAPPTFCPRIFSDVWVGGGPPGLIEFSLEVRGSEHHLGQPSTNEGWSQWVPLQPPALQADIQRCLVCCPDVP